MVISYKHKYVFFDNQRTSSRMLQDVLVRYCHGKVIEPLYGENIPFECTFNNYLMYVVVRNPYDRVVSSFLNRRRKLHEKGRSCWTFEYAVSRFTLREGWWQDRFLKYDFDLVLKYENLDEDFHKLSFLKRIKLPKFEVRTDDWRLYYTPETEAMVYDRAREVFEAFGYERLVF